MSGRLLAEFPASDALMEGVARVRASGGSAVDAFSPYPVEGLADMLGTRPPAIRPPMAAAAIVLGVAAYLTEWYSAVIDYPLDTGGRPLNSWPVFVLVPVEVALLAAAVAGLIAFMRAGGLPRLHHDVFDVPEFERTSVDRFFLLADHPESTIRLRHVLAEAGALSVTELRS